MDWLLDISIECLAGRQSRSCDGFVVTPSQLFDNLCSYQSLYHIKKLKYKAITYTCIPYFAKSQIVEKRYNEILANKQTNKLVSQYCLVSGSQLFY